MNLSITISTTILAHSISLVSTSKYNLNTTNLTWIRYMSIYCLLIIYCIQYIVIYIVWIWMTIILDRYCCKVNKKLRSPANKNKQIVHYTSQYPQKKANAAYLITSYAILYLKRNPRDAYATLIDGINQPLRPFQDASMGVSIYSIRLQGEIET